MVCQNKEQNFQVLFYDGISTKKNISNILCILKKKYLHSNQWMTFARLSLFLCRSFLSKRYVSSWHCVYVQSQYRIAPQTRQSSWFNKLYQTAYNIINIVNIEVEKEYALKNLKKIDRFFVQEGVTLSSEVVKVIKFSKIKVNAVQLGKYFSLTY